MALFTHGRGELISMLASVEGSVACLTQICERAFSKRQTDRDHLRDSEATFSCGRWPSPLHCYNRSSKNYCGSVIKSQELNQQLI